MKGADRKRWELTVDKRQGSGREAVAERSRRQTLDHRNTKRQGGRVRATSVRVNAKSKIHQGASGRAAWREGKAHVLTQGDLARESGPGVSRGHSSEEAVRKHGGAKGRRNDCNAIRKPVSRANHAPTSAASKWATTTGRPNLDRPDGAAISSGEERGTPVIMRHSGKEPATQDARMATPSGLHGNIQSLPTAGCGKPHVRWCGSPGGCKS